LKFSKEIKAALVAIAAISILILGINFLKGNSIFGGDREFYAYFPNSSQLTVSSNVTLNGVTVGKVKDIEYVPENPANKKVRITFNVQNEEVQIPIGSCIEIGNIDLLTKGLIIIMPSDLSKGFYEANSDIPGRISKDMVSQVKSFTDPITNKLQTMMASIDKMVNSLSSFWDSTATSEIEGSLKQVKLTIQKLGNVADELQLFVAEEKIQFSKIMLNVEQITNNLKKSNDQISAIIGNSKKISDDLVNANFKSVILDAQTAIKKINLVLEDVEKGNGTLGKLVQDEKLYLELVESNNELQNLVSDFQLHPERYINFSLFGAKTKGVPISKKEEKKLRVILDSIPD